MSYWLHPEAEAEAELGDAAVFYAQHASRLIAEAFLVEFERVAALLVENPRRGAPGSLGMRTYHFDRFPYTLIYEEGSQAPHLRRRSSKPRARLLGRTDVRARG